MTETWTIGKLLETAAGYLKDKGSESPRLDAELLLADSLGLERIHLYTQHDRPLTPGEVAGFRALVARRAAHEPVAYIRGKAHFRHLCLQVKPGVLIPRPETEELVELALDVLRRRPAWQDLPEEVTTGEGADDANEGAAPPADAPTIVDVGVGSGAIALSLAQEAGVRVLGIDASREALAVAAANAAALGLQGRVTMQEGDLLDGVAAGAAELVVSNPPYVRSGDIPGLAPDVRLFEPAGALDGGPDGLDVYRRLAPEAARALRPGGTLLLEVGDGQAGEVAALLQTAGFALVAVHKDMSRKDRMVEATLPGAPALTVAGLARSAAGPSAAAGLGAQPAQGAAPRPSAAARALRRALDVGAIIGLPTDTVYGIAAKWDSAPGVRRLFAAKQRSPEQPVQVLFPSVGAIKAALPDLEPTATRVLERLLPGPYTFVVATEVPRPDMVGTPDSLGVRIPDQPDLLSLLATVDVPLAATSANVTGLPAPAILAEVDALVLAHCSLAVASAPGSPAVAGTASTVVDLRPLAEGGAAVVLREGAVPTREVLSLIEACV